MITSVHLQDFKGHRDTQVSLGPFSVLVGPNSSGKTSVLEALWLQGQLVRQAPWNALSGAWSMGDLRRWGTRGATVLSSEGGSSHDRWSVDFQIVDQPWSVHGIWKDSLGVEHLHATQGSFDSRFSAHVVEALVDGAFFKPSARSIASAAYSDEIMPRIEHDGTNTAVTLAALKLGDDEAFDKIEGNMRRLIPNVERVRIRQEKARRPNPAVPQEMEEVVGRKIFFDFRGASTVPAHAASEGTLIVLALLTILHGPNRPSLLLLDDFAQSLHPQAQMELVRLIKGLLDEMPDVQIVATTHSPYILDELDPSDVHAFALRDDGTVATKRLSEHPQADKMKGALTAGQLWSLDPERDWVLAGTTP